MTTARRLALAVLAGALLTVASTLSYIPSAAYGGPGDDTPLATQQVIVFAPLTSTPFYAALRDSVTDYGCTSPEAWRLRYGTAYPVVMIVQLDADRVRVGPVHANFVPATVWAAAQFWRDPSAPDWLNDGVIREVFYGGTLPQPGQRGYDPHGLNTDREVSR